MSSAILVLVVTVLGVLAVGSLAVSMPFPASLAVAIWCPPLPPPSSEVLLLLLFLLLLLLSVALVVSEQAARLLRNKCGVCYGV